MELDYLIERLNEEIITNWPCCFCLTFGYLFSPCTLGKNKNFKFKFYFIIY